MTYGLLEHAADRAGDSAGSGGVPVLMALGVLTWLMWHMLRGHGGWK